MITVVGSPGPLFILGVCLVKENFWHLTNNVLMNATIAYVTAYNKNESLRTGYFLDLNAEYSHIAWKKDT